MKKAIIRCLVLCLLTLSFLPTTVFAEEESLYIDNITEVEVTDESVIRAFTYYSSVDDITYLVKVFDSKVELFNYSTGAFVEDAIIERTETMNLNTLVVQSLSNSVMPLSTPDNYENWGSYVFIRNDSLYIGDVASSSVSEIIGLLTGTYWNSASNLFDLAVLIYNNRYEGLDAKVHASFNSHCTILVKERYDFYKQGTQVYLRSEEMNPSWWGSPYDYTQPAACRILAQRY